MSSRVETFSSFVFAVDTLKSVFKNNRELLVRGEGLSSYSLIVDLPKLIWLDDHLLLLIKSLIPARFKIKVRFNVDDFGGILSFYQISNSTFDLKCDFSRYELDEYDDEVSVPDEAIKDFDLLKDNLKVDQQGINFEKVHIQLKSLCDKNAKIKLNLEIYIDKNEINSMLLDNIACKNSPHLATYLFPESFISHLETMSIKGYEEDFYKKDRRTIICIFDLSGYIKSDFSVVFGRNNENIIEDFFTKYLSDEILQRYKNIEDLRDDRQSGSFLTYLIPDMFDIEHNSEPDDYEMHIINQLKSFQALLSLIYLSSKVGLDCDKYTVEYKGLKLTKMDIERKEFLNFLPCSGEIYKVYRYAYDSFSRDKLDLSEYFISLISNGNINSFCENAKNIRDAIKSGYNDVLLKRTKEYFDARQKVQDAINDFINDVSENTVDLTKEVAKEAYTITGVVALGIVGTILKPELNPWMTALAISTVILFYSHLALWYYLKTLKESQDLKIE